MTLFMFNSLFFFFKQKTAYEMRISDWSSDVCSSDLSGARPRGTAAGSQRSASRRRRNCRRHPPPRVAGRRCRDCRQASVPAPRHHWRRSDVRAENRRRRSEEHTSELQSLMRISYAVFCLKKKKTTEVAKHTINITEA